MEVPSRIREVMQEYGLNHAEIIIDNIYSLCLIDDSGMFLPIGQPVLVEYHFGNARILSDKEAQKILNTL